MRFNRNTLRYWYWAAAGKLVGALLEPAKYIAEAIEEKALEQLTELRDEYRKRARRANTVAKAQA